MRKTSNDEKKEILSLTNLSYTSIKDSVNDCIYCCAVIEGLEEVFIIDIIVGFTKVTHEKELIFINKWLDIIEEDFLFDTVRYEGISENNQGIRFHEISIDPSDMNNKETLFVNNLVRLMHLYYSDVNFHNVCKLYIKLSDLCKKHKIHYNPNILMNICHFNYGLELHKNGNGYFVYFFPLHIVLDLAKYDEFVIHLSGYHSGRVTTDMSKNGINLHFHNKRDTYFYKKLKKQLLDALSSDNEDKIVDYIKIKIKQLEKAKKFEDWI